MNAITRNHEFTNRINHIEKTDVYYVVSSEKTKSIKYARTEELDRAFENEDWKTFEQMTVDYPLGVS